MPENYSRIAKERVHVNLKDIKYPSFQSWIVDTYPDTQGYRVTGGLEFYPNNSLWASVSVTRQVNMWHDKRATVVFVDGHGGLHSPGELWNVAKHLNKVVVYTNLYYRIGDVVDLTFP